MKRAVVIAIGALALFSGNCYSYSFVDSFGDGAVDSAFWSTSGDGVYESAGTLNIQRNNAADSIWTRDSFSGIQFDVRFDMCLESIVWNDMFHGVSLTDSLGNGISFGFSTYGQFYSDQHDSGGASYFYTGEVDDPAAFRTNQWYAFRLASDAPGKVNLYVDNSLLFVRYFYPVDFRVYLPGEYTDGDGGGIGDGDTTRSRIDNFSIEVVAPEPSGILAILSGAAGLCGFGFRKRK